MVVSLHNNMAYMAVEVEVYLHWYLTLAQALFETCGGPGQANTLAPVQTDILKNFSA